jgi:hypothetical protein
LAYVLVDISFEVLGLEVFNTGWYLEKDSFESDFVNKLLVIANVYDVEPLEAWEVNTWLLDAGK